MKRDSKPKLFCSRCESTNLNRSRRRGSCVGAVVFIPNFHRGFLRGSHTNTCVTRGLRRSCSRAAQDPSSRVTCKLPHRLCRTEESSRLWFPGLLPPPACRQNPERPPRSLLDEHPAQYTSRHSRGCSFL